MTEKTEMWKIIEFAGKKEDTKAGFALGWIRSSTPLASLESTPVRHYTSRVWFVYLF